MRFIGIILVLVYAIGLQGQGIEPTQIQGASKLNQILQAKTMYIDEYGDTMYIYQHTDFATAIGADSIYLSNDTILLRDGVGFVKLPENVGVDSIYLSNDTIYLRDGDGFVKLPEGGDGSPTDEIQDLYPYNTGFVLSNPTVPLQDTVLFEWTNSIVTPYPEGCDCSVEEIPTLTYRLSQKADSAHLHYISDVIGLTGALGDKSDIGHTHIIDNVTGLQTALDGKEPAFSKGNLVAGTNVTLSGTLTNRLVGSGDVTINATGGGGSVTATEAIRTAGDFSLSTSYQSILSQTLAAGTYFINLNASALIGSGSVDVQLWNATLNMNYGVSTIDGTLSSASLNRVITLDATTTIQLRAKGAVGNSIRGGSGTGFVAIKIN